MIHRHLDYPEGTQVTAKGDAALDDLLTRGDLIEWRSIALAIKLEPEGEMARRVLWLCDANPRYGTSPLWRAWIDRQRALRAMAQAPAVSLAELRSQIGVSQSALALRIGMSQSDLSKAERRTDWKISTLSLIVAGLGLRMKVLIENELGEVIARLRIAVPRTRSLAKKPANLRRKS